MKLTSLLLFILLSYWAVAQSKPALEISYFPSRFEPVMKAELDTSLNVSRYSLAQARELMAKLEVADQRYRIEYMRYWNAGKLDTDSARYYGKRFVVNDKANQVLFIKLLRKFGWPTISKFGTKHSVTGWLVAWHGGDEYQEKILPYLRKAYEARDIESEHYLSIQRKFDAVKVFTSR